MKNSLITIILLFAMFACSKTEEGSPAVSEPVATGTLLFDEEVVGTNINVSEKNRLTSIEVAAKSSSSLTFPDPSAGFGASHKTPRFSSDKLSIIYSSNRNGNLNNFDIYISSRDGSTSKLITNTPNRNEYEPSFSPDMLKIAYIAADANGHQQIFINSINGGSEQQITHFSHSTRKVYCNQTSFSKDGTTIYFSSNKDTTKANIYSVKTNGSGLQRVSVNNTSNEYVTSLSPSGDKIAYYSNTATAYEIFTMGIDGSNKKQLTTIDKISGDPCWSPDGNFICFLSTKDRPAGGPINPDVFLIKADGTGLTKLTSYDSYKGSIDWK